MTTAQDQELLAIPDKRAAKLAGVTVRQLHYWEEVGLVTPTIEHRFSTRNIVRLYGYRDLLELLVVATLRTEMTLQHIRKVVEHLRHRGYPSPLSEIVFATHEGAIYMQHPGGEWEGDIRPDQIVLEQVLRLDRLEAKIESSRQRPAEARGEIVRRRGVKGSRPIFAGTRITVDTVRDYLDAGYTDGQILEEYPTLTAADINAARRHAAAS